MSLPDFHVRAFARARTLAVDALVAEVFPALRAAGVHPVLLKGASLVGWIYEPEENRAYTDVDVLVAPEQLGVAQDLLRGLGFELEVVEYPPAHARTWRRERDRAAVDLHRTLPGIRIAPQEAWPILSEDLERRVVHGVEVDVLGAPGRALLVALHVAHHEIDSVPGMLRKSGRDLEKALDRLPAAIWQDAAVLATRLHCREGLAAGLRSDRQGEAVARRLGLPDPSWLDAGPKRPTTAAFERLAAVDGRSERVRMGVRMLLPSRAAMRWQSRLAARGRLGLTAAYALRPLHLLVSGVPGLLEWRRLRRASRPRR